MATWGPEVTEQFTVGCFTQTRHLYKVIDLHVHCFNLKVSYTLIYTENI